MLDFKSPMPLTALSLHVQTVEIVEQSKHRHKNLGFPPLVLEMFMGDEIHLL